MKKFTHVAYKVGSDARTPDNYRAIVFIRETANFWVDKYGSKYSKNDGHGTGTWPMYKITSLKKIPTHKGKIISKDKIQDVFLWQENNIFVTMGGKGFNDQGVPLNPLNPYNLDMSSVKPFDSSMIPQ